jgi:hypothetical protein
LDNRSVIFRGVGLRDAALSAAPVRGCVRKAFNHSSLVSVCIGNAGNFAYEPAKHQQMMITFRQRGSGIHRSIPLREFVNRWTPDI